MFWVLRGAITHLSNTGVSCDRKAPACQQSAPPKRSQGESSYRLVCNVALQRMTCGPGWCVCLLGLLMRTRGDMPHTATRNLMVSACCVRRRAAHTFPELLRTSAHTRSESGFTKCAWLRAVKLGCEGASAHLRHRGARCAEPRAHILAARLVALCCGHRLRKIGKGMRRLQAHIVACARSAAFNLDT